MPANCPVCGSPVTRLEDQAVYKCTGGVLKCRAQRAEWIMHFAGRRAMDIEGLGEKLIEQLVEDGSVSTPADLYALEAKSLAERERMGEKSAKNVVDAIDKSRTRHWPRFLFGLGIPQVGESTARALAEQFGNLDDADAGQRRHRSRKRRTSGPSCPREVCEFFAEPAGAGRDRAHARRRRRVEGHRRAARGGAAARRPHLRHHRNAGGPAARGGRGRAARARRQGFGQRLEEDQLSRGRRGRGLQAREGAVTRRARFSTKPRSSRS